MESAFIIRGLRITVNYLVKPQRVQSSMLIIISYKVECKFYSFRHFHPFYKNICVMSQFDFHNHLIYNGCIFNFAEFSSKKSKG